VHDWPLVHWDGAPSRRYFVSPVRQCKI
jgi:hypothetical protein